MNNTTPYLVYARRGTLAEPFVELCLKDTETSDLIIRKITPKIARHLAAQLLVAADIG